MDERIASRAERRDHVPRVRKRTLLVGGVGLAGLATLVLSLFSWGGSVDTTIAPTLFGVIGLAAMGDSGGAIEQLTTKIRQFQAGESVDFSTDRDDELGELYEAVGGMAETARERRSDLETSERYRQRLYEVTSAPEMSDDEKIDRLLELGRERLGAENGHIVRIDEREGRHEVERASGSDIVTAGTVTDLSETFCRETITAEGALGIGNTPAEGYEDDPAYREWGIGCYIGGKIMVEEELFGTVCFVSEKPRDSPFSATEKSFVDLLSRWVSHVFERRKRDSELRVRERAIDAAPVGVAIAEARGEDNPLVQVNDAFERVTGYDAADVEGRDCRFLQGEDTDEQSVAELREAIEAKRPVTTELKNYRADGTEFWNRVSIAPVADDDGEVTHFVGFQEDVTERNEREAELERQASMLDSIFDQIPIHLYVKDEEARNVRVSSEFFNETAYRDESEFVGKTDLDMLPESVAEETYADDMQVIEEDESIMGKLEHHTGRWFLTSKVPWRSSDGDVRGLIGVTLDITERKERERELEAIVENTKNPIFIKDRDGVYQFANEAASKPWGYGSDEIVGKTDEDLFDPPNVEAVRAGDEHVVETGEHITQETTLTVDGEDITFLDEKYPYRDDDGEIIGVMGISRDITQRKAYERELETTSARLEALFENSPDMIEILDTEGTIVDANRRLCDELAYDEDELVGSKIWDYDSGADRDEVLALLEDMAVGERRRFEGQYERSDSSTFPVEIHLIHLDLAEENRFMAISRDITEQKERERDLRETKRRLEVALEGTNTGVWEWDLETDEVSWTETLERLVGLDPGEFPGTYDAFEQRVHPDDRKRVVEEDKEAIERGELVTSEFRLQHEDGRWIWVGSSGRLVTDEDGKRMVGIDYDITERKERERDLRETKHQLELALEGTNTGVFEWDLETNEVSWSETQERLVGLDPGEFEGTYEAFLERVHPDDRSQVEAEDERRAQADEPVQTEFRLRHENGHWVWVGTSGRVVDDEDGRRMIGVNYDITERKEREAELERASEMLEQSQRLAHVGAWEYTIEDGEGVELSWTDEVYRIHDLSPGTDVPLEDAIAFYHPDDRDDVRDAVERAIEHAEPYNFEARLITADGEERWVRSIGDPVVSDGEVVRIQGSIQDVTERKVAEQQLREREQRLERYREYTDQILDAIDDVFYVVGPDLSFQRWNESLAAVTGYIDEEIAEAHPTEFVVDEDESAIASAIQEVFETGSARTEARIRTKDGETIPYEFAGSALEDPDGNQVLVGIGRDVSERKERERELERQASLLDSLFEQIPVSLYVKDREARHVRTSTPYQENDYPDDEEWFRGKTDPEIYHEAFAEETHADDLAVIESGEPILEQEEYNPDEDAWVLTSKVPWRGDGGDVRGLIGITQYITEQIERQEELRETRDRLEANNESLQRLYAITADSELSFDEKVQQVLDLGRERLGTATGYLARIDQEGDRFEIVHATGDDERIYPTATAPLSETYCREIIDADGAVSVVDAGTDGWPDEETHERWGHDYYVGASVTVSGEFYGTFCFVDTDARETRFTDEERRFVELASQWLRYELERRQREERLEKYQTYTDDILNSIEDVFYVLNEDGYPRRWNDRFVDVMGVPESEIPDLHRSEVFDEEDAKAISDSITEAFATGSARVEAVMRPKDGGAIPYEFTAVSLEDPDGEPVIAGLGRDMSEREEREEKLRETRDRLAQQNRTLRRLYEISADQETDFEEKIQRLLDLGRERLDTSGAFVSRIEPDANEFEFVHASGTIDAITPGVTAPYSESYCRRVVESDDIVEVLDAEAEGWATDPAFVRWGLGTYFGQRIYVGGELVGTLAFVDTEAADEPLSDDERAFVELVTQWVSYELERRERERELAEYQEFTDDILDATDDVFYLLDDEGYLHRWNESLTNVTGYDDDEIATMHSREFFAEADQSSIAAAIEEVFETGSTLVEAPYLTKDGKSIPFEFIANAVENPDGETRLAGIGRDISDRKRREHQLRHTKERMQKFIETSPVGVLATKPDGTVSLWNDAMEEIFGWSEAEVLGQPYPAAPDDATMDPESIRDRALAGESFTQVELERVTKDGERIDISLSTNPIFDDDGDVVEIVGYIQDITERKQRERELQARSAAMDGAIDGMSILNEENEYTYVNPAKAEIYGYDDPEAFLGENWEMCYDDDSFDRLEREALPELQDGGSWREEIVGLRADGTTFPQEISLSMLDDGRMVCVVRDVTERKERERDLQRATQMLEQAQRIAQVGGWELDLRTDPPEMTWTDELYRLHGMALDAELDLDEILERYHPDDREHIADLMDEAISAGESYDMEVRLQASTEQTRWVRAIGEPVTEDSEGRSPSGDRTQSGDDEVVRIQGSIQDITAQKEHEQALRSLHEATRGLLGAETEADVADIVVDAATDVLDTGGIALYLLDSESNRLEPAAYTDGFTALCGGAPSVGAGDGDSLLWNCFVTGTPTVFDDTDALSHSKLLGPDVGGGLLFPLGDHGVFVVATTATTINTGTRQLAETLVATTETALDRLESEASLRERDAELESRNERLQRQVQITDIIRGIDRSLIQANSREEIERAVCRQLVEAEDVAFAWIGTVDGSGETLAPSAWAGSGDEYLDAVSLETDVESPEPAAATATSEQPTIVGNVVDNMKREPWRKSALASDFHSVLSVPLTYEGYFYGVLAVYADEPEVFDELELTVFAELGTNIANSINAIETRRALHADTLVELSLVIDRDDTFLGRIASAANCTIEYEGLATHTDEESRLFFAAIDSDPDTIEAILDDLVSVQDFRQVDESDDRLLYEVTVAGEVLPARLVRHGASPRSIQVTEAGTEVVVDIPTKTDVREFVGMLRDIAPSIELVGKRTVERATQTRQELVSNLFGTLTERQLEVLRTAYFAGFFEWPRTSTGEDVAEMLDVTQPTVNRHLRLAQQRLLEQLLDESAPAASAD